MHRQPMNNVRLFRIQRKQIVWLVAAITIALIYVQFVSYELISSTVATTHYRNVELKCKYGGVEPIDVVYTWVNGSDEEFQRALAETKRLEGDNVKFESYSVQRFDDKDELKYSLRSIEKHMPWVRHVYIVTNGQIPSWLDMDYDKVSLVTHSEIFQYDEDLPTFSSPAIEANLHRIPGLSEKFIYFNDDVFLNADVYPEDFHTNSEGFKIYTAWLMQDCAYDCRWEMLNDGKCDAACYNKDCDYDVTDCVDLVSQLTTKVNNDKMAAVTEPIPLAYEGFLATNEENGTYLNARIKQYNEDKMKEVKLMRHLQRQQNDDDIAYDDVAYVNASPNGTSGNYTIIKKRAKFNKDLFSASLLFTQKLLAQKFGYQQRRVIAHAPIMFHRTIMANVQDTFPDEFRRTMRERFRHASNLQISFLYSYYLSLATVDKSLSDIFDEYDTDQSGTWSDREIRTLLSRLYPLPLSYHMLVEFENALINCTNLLTPGDLAHEQAKSTPEYERYVDSPLTVVTKKMIVECPDLQRRFAQYPRISKRNKYKWTMVNSSRTVTFNMLQSQMAFIMNMLDNIRKYPKKFVCINDDLDRSNATRIDNELIVTLLMDFFVSLFPMRSKFELQPAYRNRFARIDDLRQWRTTHHWRLDFHSTTANAATISIVCVCLFCFGYVCCYLRRRRRCFDRGFRSIVDTKTKWIS